jgi:hypothetical protein
MQFCAQASSSARQQNTKCDARHGVHLCAASQCSPIIQLEEQMNRSAKWIVGGLAAVAGLGAVSATLYYYLSPYSKYLLVLRDPVEGMQLVMADVLRAKLPTRVNATTEMVDVQAHGKMLTFVFNVRAQKAGGQDWMGGKQALLKQTCSNEGFKKALDLGASYRFEFRDARAAPLGGFTVANGDCQA